MPKIKILIAEDDPLIRRLFDIHLPEATFEKKFAENGQIALEAYKKWRPDIMVLDLMMPIRNGFQVLQNIRVTRHDKKTTIIMVTSSSEKEDVMTCVNIGVQGYIVKPFIAKEIAGQILKFHAKKSKKGKMRVKYLNPFLLSAKKTVETMGQIPIRAKALQHKKDKMAFGEVTGIIGMSSAKISGNMIVSFSQSCILKIAANMLMEPEKEEIDKDVVDVVGELTNIICGGAKSRLSQENINFDMSTPTVIKGKNFKIHYRADAEIFVIPFSTAFGDFVVEANLAVQA